MYFQASDNYKRARGRHRYAKANYSDALGRHRYAEAVYSDSLGHYRYAEAQLMQLLGATDGDADLERAILDARTAGRHYAAISDYCQKSFILDQATSDLEAARRFIDYHTGTNAGVDSDLQVLEC